MLRDLDDKELHEGVRAFAAQMRAVRVRLAQAERLYYDHQKADVALDAAIMYCDAILQFAEVLGRTDLASEGMRAIREYTAGYVASQAFSRLRSEAGRIREELTGITYRVHLKGSRVTVTAYEPEPDYRAEIEETFARFRQGDVKDYRVPYLDDPSMNHVEHQILLLVARLHPELFQSLLDFRERHKDFLDATLVRFDREIQFYLGYLDTLAPLRQAGLSACIPQVSSSKDERIEEGFDLALALRLAPDGKPVVCNDVRLEGPERILVVSGPNQGGKTTFARAFGQAHWLAALGLPVPGRAARLLLCDQVLTHFQREESGNLQGQLQEELERLRDILARATGRTVLILNESFSSTTARDAAVIGREVLEEVVRRDMPGVYVTFLDELSRLGPAFVSMASTVVPEDPATRTFRVVRKPADGLAYALAIAERHGLSYEALRERIGR